MVLHHLLATCLRHNLYCSTAVIAEDDSAADAPAQAQPQAVGDFNYTKVNGIKLAAAFAGFSAADSDAKHNLAQLIKASIVKFNPCYNNNKRTIVSSKGKLKPGKKAKLVEDVFNNLP